MPSEIIFFTTSHSSIIILWVTENLYIFKGICVLFLAFQVPGSLLKLIKWIVRWVCGYKIHSEQMWTTCSKASSRIHSRASGLVPVVWWWQQGLQFSASADFQSPYTPGTVSTDTGIHSYTMSKENSQITSQLCRNCVQCQRSEEVKLHSISQQRHFSLISYTGIQRLLFKGCFHTSSVWFGVLDPVSLFHLKAVYCILLQTKQPKPGLGPRPGRLFCNLFDVWKGNGLTIVLCDVVLAWNYWTKLLKYAAISL